MSLNKSNWNCPNLSQGSNEVIDLAIGEGAKASRAFLDQFVYARFHSEILQRRQDAAILELNATQIAFTTDSFVVTPHFFPGGDIGKLAVCGAMNDLCMVWAEPTWMSIGLILEEGFPLSDLSRILDSLLHWSQRANVEVVCGDTKVVSKGKMDGIFINTSAIGLKFDRSCTEQKPMSEGDRVIVSGEIGCHGMSIMAARTPGLIETEIISDCDLLLPLVQALYAEKIAVKAMRDATRGGVAAVLHEWAREFGISIRLDEANVPVRDDVRGLSELLGLDPLFVANEGTMVLVVDQQDVDRALNALRSVSLGAKAAVVGCVENRRRNPVTVTRGFGREIPLSEPTGAPLPRIC